MKREERIIDIIKEAGALIKKRTQESYNIDIKNNNRADLVTSVDVEIEKFLIKEISKDFSNDAFLTEEKSISFIPSEYTWIIDPIDGTMNFVYFDRDFAISVALYKDDKPYMGIVYDIMADEFIVGIVGEGVTINGNPVHELPNVDLKHAIVDISVSTFEGLNNARIATFHDLTKKVLSHRNMGSAAIRTAQVGLGRIHAYMSSHLYIWDVAAGCIILEELGGCYSLIDRKSLTLDSEQFKFIAVQSEQLMKEIEDEFFDIEIQ